ncbi:Tnpo1 protein [Mycena filopes]|nr:Tnpo1 protein [Mycena filopes]
MLILYDAVGTLADAVGRALQNPRYAEILPPPLTNRWARLKDDDEDLIPLLEVLPRVCLASVTIAIGIAFLPYAGPQNPELEQPDKSFLVVALGPHAGTGHGAAAAHRQLHLEPAHLVPQAPVRQSAYALVGDMAMGCFQWVNPLITILLHPKAPRSLHENAAVSTGRIGLSHPDIAWCQALYEIRDNEDWAFRAFARLSRRIRRRWPRCVVFAFCVRRANERMIFFTELAVVLQRDCEVESAASALNEMFQTLLQGFKQQPLADTKKTGELELKG